MLESRRLNQSLLESSTDCIKFLDLEVRLLFMNGLGCKALEIDDFALVANTYWLDFWKGPFAGTARAAVETAKAGGVGHFQGYCPTFKGTPKWWDVVITPLTDGDGRPEQLLVVTRDITESKLIEERLRTGEVRLRKVQRLAGIGSWEQHIDTGRSCWSDEIRQILGVANDAPADLSAFVNCVHPRDREKLLESDRRVCSSPDPVETEYRIARPDGEVRFVRSTVEGIRNDSGETVRLVGATQDITEQVRSREVLRESEERLRNAERLTHVGHWRWDL